MRPDRFLRVGFKGVFPRSFRFCFFFACGNADELDLLEGVSQFFLGKLLAPNRVARSQRPLRVCFFPQICCRCCVSLPPFSFFLVCLERKELKTPPRSESEVVARQPVSKVWCSPPPSHAGVGCSVVVWCIVVVSRCVV